jgi:nitrate reductase NapAB chaperone NapD
MTDPATGRIVVVLETESVGEQESGLRHLQSLPRVISAELVYHYFGPDATTAAVKPVRSNS